MIGAGAIFGLLGFWVAAKPDSEPAMEQITLKESLPIDCGPACLYLLCKLEGEDRPVDFLYRLSHTVKGRTTMLDLAAACRSLGFGTTACQTSFDDLARTTSAGEYAILHVDDSHFVLGLPTSDDKAVRIFDPQSGVLDCTQESFHARYQWDGSILFIKPAK